MQHLKRSGPLAFGDFYDALVRTNQHELAALLEPGRGGETDTVEP